MTDLDDRILDDRLRKHYDSIRLPQESMSVLLETVNDIAESKPSAHYQSHNDSLSSHAARNYTASSHTATQTTAPLTTRSPMDRVRQLNPFQWRQMQWVAGFCMLAVSALFMYSTATHNERTERTFREVAMNHATRLDLEFYEDTAASIDQQMAQLPFTLVLPERMDDNYELLGSRYCSLAGNLAAHVKLRDRNTGKSASLFITSLTDELKPVNNASSDLDGLDVELFQEGGLFYAFAHQS